MSTILLVDDDPDILKLISLRLTAAGHSVKGANSGEKALAVLAASRLELVITDLTMGGMDGLTLFDEIRKQAPTLPVIILTAARVEAWWRSIDGPSRKICSNPNRSATAKARRPVRATITRGSSPPPTEGRCFWMKSATCRLLCRPSSYACCRTSKCVRSVRLRGRQSTCASSPPRTATSTPR